MSCNNVVVKVSRSSLVLTVDLDANKEARQRDKLRCLASAIIQVEQFDPVLNLDFMVYQPTERSDAHSQTVWGNRAPEGLPLNCLMEIRERTLEFQVDVSKVRQRVESSDGCIEDVIVFHNERFEIDGVPHRVQIRLTRPVLATA